MISDDLGLSPQVEYVTSKGNSLLGLSKETLKNDKKGEKLDSYMWQDQYVNMQVLYKYILVLASEYLLVNISGTSGPRNVSLLHLLCTIQKYGYVTFHHVR